MKNKDAGIERGRVHEKSRNADDAKSKKLREGSCELHQEFLPALLASSEPIDDIPWESQIVHSLHFPTRMCDRIQDQAARQAQERKYHDAGAQYGRGETRDKACRHELGDDGHAQHQ